MAHVNIEIKARCDDLEYIRTLLEQNGADYKGRDRQIDTYFKVPSGRLKLRQGNIENALIFYDRPDAAGPKRADVQLFRTDPAGSEQLYAILTAALDVKVVVDKQRDIYFIDNVKFHLDTVEGLGTFVEIEAIDETGIISPEKLQRQCEHYTKLSNITDTDLINISYSDMLLERRNKQ